MNYLKFYCETFNLKIEGDNIFDEKSKLVGRIEDEKYVHFTHQGLVTKLSDLLLPALEEISVHS